MRIRLSDHQAGILLAATLMNWGYPFHFTRRCVFPSREQEIIDAAEERLIGRRRENHEQGTPGPRQIEFSAEEAQLFAKLLEVCLAECGHNETEIHLQLWADTEDEVCALTDQLRRMADPKYPP